MGVTLKAVAATARLVVKGPPGVVMVMVRAPPPALPEMLKVTVTVVALTTTRLLVVTFRPDTETAVAPSRFVPVKVIGSASGRGAALVEGDTPVIVGRGTGAVTDNCAASGASAKPAGVVTRSP